MNLVVLPSPAAVAERAHELLWEHYFRAIAERNRFTVALSGGSTPRQLHAILADDPDFDWTRVFITLSDERWVPADDEQSNARMVHETLLQYAPEAEFLPLYHGTSPAEDAERASKAMTKALQKARGLDMLFAGIGADAHTLSLFPGEPYAATWQDRPGVVIDTTAPVNAPDRLSLSVEFALRSQQIIVLATGTEKADALAHAIESPIDPATYPVQALVRAGNAVVTILADTAAAAKLSSAA
ncbi:MAG: 6-phosphogluconolactonase [Fimbriimonadaceae bacterium]|nr:6-phosphogluconolactonase [Fimbriimonadaceae bacterium]